MGAQLFQVDAFTSQPFRGNPAGVVPLSGPAEEAWMEQVAAEMNVSETAFVYRRDRRWQLRWFTPVTEVELCGHATLATAHILWEQGEHGPDEPMVFDTLSGELGARRSDEAICLDFPLLAVAAVKPPPALLAGLRVKVTATWSSRYALIAEVDSPTVVAGLVPDLEQLRRLDTQSVIVTAHGDGAPYDFVSRVFAPRVGTDEDPVTGSAHCALGPLWADKLGTNRLRAYQASPRGGEMSVVVGKERVTLVGQAITVMRATLA